MIRPNGSRNDLISLSDGIAFAIPGLFGPSETVACADSKDFHINPGWWKKAPATAGIVPEPRPGRISLRRLNSSAGPITKQKIAAVFPGKPSPIRLYDSCAVGLGKHRRIGRRAFVSPA